MGDSRPRGSFSDETNATPLVRLTDAVAQGPQRPCLVVIAGPHLGEIFPIESDELVIGRDNECRLKLLDDESVSRRHALVRRSGEGALIQDLGSANGTFVDGQ